MERWCNEVAAELLVPEEALREAHEPSLLVQEEMARLAKVFKVSTLVVLRRLFDAGLIDQATLERCYREEVEHILSLEREQKATGGDYYRTMGVRAGKRFSRAVLASALEGQTLFRDAFRLLGMRKSATFFKAARELGVML
jgi:Zn-dependent peptidase ImmA (M78 family)